jgi:NitT/TauT family transport system substrate-binding protein
MWPIVLLMALAACSAPSQPATATPPTNVTIQLSWVHEYSSAPFYAAEKNGHFAEQHLAVRLEQGGFNGTGYVDPIGQILSGSADIGMSDASSLLLARAQGKPVVAIAAMLQRSPLAVISLGESGIQRPSDLIGRRVAVAEGGAQQTFTTLLTTQGIAVDQVQIVPRTTYGIEPLLNGEVDALVAWIINEGVQLKEAGKTTNVMLMSDYGVDTYDFVLFTTETMLREHPDTVERTLRAVNGGLQDVIKNPDQAVQWTLSYNPELDADGQLRRLQATIPLFNPAGSKPGMMEAATWDTTYRILHDQGALTAPVDTKSAYTMAVLEQVYAH